MVKLRFKRVGKKKQPHYRLVATDSRNARDGKIIENIGHFNPCANPVTINFNEEKVLLWLKKGALPSDTVKKLLIKNGIWERFTGKKETPVYASAKAPKKKAQEILKQTQEKQAKAQEVQAEPQQAQPEPQAENKIEAAQT